MGVIMDIGSGFSIPSLIENHKTQGAGRSQWSFISRYLHPEGGSTQALIRQFVPCPGVIARSVLIQSSQCMVGLIRGSRLSILFSVSLPA